MNRTKIVGMLAVSMLISSLCFAQDSGIVSCQDLCWTSTKTSVSTDWVIRPWDTYSIDPSKDTNSLEKTVQAEADAIKAICQILTMLKSSSASAVLDRVRHAVVFGEIDHKVPKK